MAYTSVMTARAMAMDFFVYVFMFILILSFVFLVLSYFDFTQENGHLFYYFNQTSRTNPRWPKQLLCMAERRMTLCLLNLATPMPIRFFVIHRTIKPSLPDLGLRA